MATLFSFVTATHDPVSKTRKSSTKKHRLVTISNRTRKVSAYGVDYGSPRIPAVNTPPVAGWYDE